MRSVWSQIGLAVGAAATIVVAARVSRPYYVSRGPVAAQLIAHAYVDSAVDERAPWMSASVEEALKSPRFLLDRELFTMDLLRTGKVSVERARALADVAVREAYTRRLPPALVLGVMLTENDELKSSARSHIGAIGLMQVYPKPWRNALAHKFGTNIHTDSTNLKYGIFILSWVSRKRRRSSTIATPRGEAPCSDTTAACTAATRGTVTATRTSSAARSSTRPSRAAAARTSTSAS